MCIGSVPGRSFIMGWIRQKAFESAVQEGGLDLENAAGLRHLLLRQNTASPEQLAITA